MWWNHRLPSEIRDKETEKTRAHFQSKNVTEITSDVVFALGSKKIASHNKANAADAKNRAVD